VARAAHLSIIGFKQTMRKIFSLIFVFLLLTPAVVWLSDLDLDLQMDRIGLKPPRFSGRALFNNEYYLSFDQYFNDSFSLRNPLILAKRWLDYRIFHMTDIEGIHVGKDGWIYSRQSIEDYRKEACNRRQDIERLVLEFHAIEKMIEATGRRFFFLVAPNKSTIYPEYVGFVPNRTTCNRSQYDLFLETIGSHPLKSFVRLEQLLQDTKINNPLLYDKTSTHWNDLGARVAAEAIQAQIIQDDRQKRAFDYKRRVVDDTGDLHRRLMGYLTRVDDVPLMHIASSGKSEFSSAIVYGDDFITSLIPYLAQIFSQLQVIRPNSIPSRQYGEDLHASDLILLERAESELKTMRLEMDSIFSIFEAEASIPVRYLIDLKRSVAGAKVSLDKSGEYLEIKSVGHRSNFKLPAIPASNDRIFRVLKLTVEALHSDIMTVEYQTVPTLVQLKSLKPGITTLYLPLPFQDMISLNIHPGNKAGVLILQSAEILEFSKMPGAAESGLEEKLLVKLDKKNGSEVPDTESKTVVTESDPDIGISDPKLNENELAAGSKLDPPLNNPVSKLKPALVVEKDTEESNEPNQQDTKIPITAKQTVTGNPNTIAGNMKVQTREPEITQKVAAMPVATSPSLTLNDFEDGGIFQRQGKAADIVVSGTYSGQIEAIEARVVRENTNEEIVPWKVIDSALRNGIFVGKLANVPQGGWYNIQVRSQNDPTVFISGQHKWGVGMLIACLGQSNMKEWFFTGKDLVAHSLLRKFSDLGWAKFGVQGNAAIAFGNRIIDRLGVPVGLLDYSVNGSGLRKEADWGTGYWEDTSPNSIYDRFIAGVSNADGALEFVIWIQGEADAARATVTKQEYADSLEHFIINQVRSDIANGSNRQNLPFLVVMMIKRPGGKDGPHQDIRDAQRHVVENVADCYLAATTLDLKNHGRQHLTPKAYISMGNRVAQTVLYVLGKETYHRGPRVVNVKQIDSNTIEIAIEHNGGNDFKPVTGITGWEVIADGTSVPIKKVYRHDPQTIRIRFERPLDDNAQIRYLFGAIPDVKNPVIDNSPLSLPLEEFHSVIN
jgi:hypothetical protein